MSTTYQVITEKLLSNDSAHQHDDDDENSQQLLVAKIAGIFILGIITFVLGALPIQLSKWFKWNLQQRGSENSLVISLLLCFGGGVLLCTTFLHLQPEVREQFAVLQEQGLLPDAANDMNLSELVFCIGFFFVYLIEECVHSILDNRHNVHDEETVLHRTMSLRRCSRKDQQEPATLIPRVSLAQGSESAAKSTSTQILFDSSSSTDSQATDLAYIPKVLEPELVLQGFPKHNHHSHMVFEEDSDSMVTNKLSKSISGFCTILALSFHSVFEGLAVGLEGSVSNVWYLTLAVCTHKFVIAFCVGLELLTSKTRTFLILVYMGTFAVVSPIGIGVGIGLSHNQDPSEGNVAAVMLQAMAAGTLLYVVFFEVLQRERANSQSGILQLIAILAGFGVLFSLQILTGHKHSHDSGHLHLATITSKPVREHFSNTRELFDVHGHEHGSDSHDY